MSAAPASGSSAPDPSRKRPRGIPGGPGLARLLIRPCRREPPQSVRRIVLVKGGALGDVLMTTPLLRAVRQSWPEAEITYFLGRWSAPVLAHNPHVDRVEAVDDAVFFRRRWSDVWHLARRVKRGRFDLGFILDRQYTAGMFGWLSAIEYRVGFDRDGEGFAHHRTVDVAARRYDGEYYLDLVRALGRPVELGRMELFPGDDDEAFAERRFTESGLDRSPVLGLAVAGGQNPGRIQVFKRWPTAHYRQLLERLESHFPEARYALFGGPGDTELHAEVRGASERVVDLAGATVLQSAAMMRRCRLFVTHDSGPMHMAAAMGVPVVAIFGPTDPVRLAPPGPENTVLFRPDEVGALAYDVRGDMPDDLPDPLPCLAAIQPADVIEVIERRYLDRLR